MTRAGLLLTVVVVGCGSKGTKSPGRPDGAAPADALMSTHDGAGVGDSARPVDLAMTLMAAPTSCAPAITLVDTSTPTATVGTGAGTCTQPALQNALTGGGKIVFNCGGAATIPLTSQLLVPSTVDTVLDGNNLITLDGGGVTRILYYTSGDYRGMYGGPQHLLTVQRMTLQNGAAPPSSPFPAASPPCSQGYQLGSGGAIWMDRGSLHVIDVTFKNNAAAATGPDVGGGAVYTDGSSDTTIVGSTFSGNTGSNAGAVGALNSELALTNDTFDSNQALGQGANSTNGTCPVVGGQRETGSGGNGGAVAIDGGDNGTVDICGCTFTNNSGHANGGAFFRTPDGAQMATHFNLCTFDHNSCSGSYNGMPTGQGGALYLHNSAVTVDATTFSNNSGPGGGALVGDGTTITLTNSTLYGNTATTGVGGAIGGLGGTLINCTFANNQAQGTAYAAFAAALFGGPWTIRNTIFDGNTDNDNSGNETCAYFGGSNSGSDNLQWPHGSLDSACTPGITYADAMVGALGNHGGLTQTAAPAASSATVQIGQSCPPNDQTGHPRATPCTVGALETTP